MKLKPIHIKNNRNIDVIAQNGQRVVVHVAPHGSLFVTIYAHGNKGEIELNYDANDRNYLSASVSDENQYADVTMVANYPAL